MAPAHTAALAEVCWRIIPVETPRVVRHCVKCGETRRFASSNHFRLNAQQRRVDVWLIYKCTICENTWNCTILSRCTPEEIGQELYQRFQQNDHDLAWRYAFDFGLLSQMGVCVEASVQVCVERSTQNSSGATMRPQLITLELSYPCKVRLDRLLADELGVSRSCLHQWYDRGLLRIRPEEKNALRRPVRNGQTILLLAGETEIER